MTNENKLSIKGYPPVVVGKWYPAQVTRVSEPKRGKYSSLTLEHLHKQQEGHVLKTQLTFPARPNCRTGRFLQACGLRTEEGATFELKTLEGRVIEVMLGDDGSGNLDVIAFRPVKRKANNGSAAE